jgi:Fe-S cluster assembly protein SufD
MLVQETTGLLDQLHKLAVERVHDPSRAEAWKQFLAKGFPQKSDEQFRYLALRELYEHTFSKPQGANPYALAPVESDVCRIVLVDGILSQSLSYLELLPKEIVLCTLTEAQRSYGVLLKNKASKLMHSERSSSLSTLNHALHDEGLFLYVPPKLIFKYRIELIELYSSTTSALYFPKYSIYLGRQASAHITIQVKNVTSEAIHFVNRVVEAHLDAQSLLHIHAEFLEVGKCWYFDQSALFLKRDASCSYVSGDTGSRLLRQDFRVDLLEENAQVVLKSLSLLKKKDQAHHYVRIRHLAPGCRSSQHFKGVLFDQAVLSFEGKIWVDAVAQKTEAYQRSNHLILGEGARAYSKPNLEIFADDVKASHGATVAQLNQEEIFYLQARGLSSPHAKQVLVSGFCKTLLEEMNHSYKNAMLRYLQEGLNIL